jgi:hypothetical protein
MDNKLLAVCLVLSFLLGAYLVLMIDKMRDYDRECTVTFRHGNETTVVMGGKR